MKIYKILIDKAKEGDTTNLDNYINHRETAASCQFKTKEKILFGLKRDFFNSKYLGSYLDTISYVGQSKDSQNLEFRKNKGSYTWKLYGMHYLK
jgi:hypothetical protein